MTPHDCTVTTSPREQIAREMHANDVCAAVNLAIGATERAGWPDLSIALARVLKDAVARRQALYDSAVC